MDQPQSVSRNRRSADSWQRYTSHRQHITQWLSKLRPDVLSVADDSRSQSTVSECDLAVLGAGNVNDLDLSLLASQFRRIVLMDWDQDAMIAGVERQSAAVDSALLQRIEISDSVDLSITSTETKAFGRFDVVASVGLLSQMTELALAQLSESGITDPEMIVGDLQRVRCNHFALIDSMLTGHGSALLTTEFVSSDTLPTLSQASDSDLPKLLHKALVSRNFFSGMQPSSIIQSANGVFRQSRQVTPTDPWKWDFGPRTYAVVAYLITP